MLEAPRKHRAWILTAGIIFAGAPAPATQLTLTCEGEAPAWRLDLNDVHARLTVEAPLDMSVELSTDAMGRQWPKALTLVSTRDTAIVLLDKQQCGAEGADMSAMVLTQRGQTPILLAGCCVTN
ncbi:MAG: hypothetical protein AAF667_03120 [Pseudomonadota bacterium]